MTIRKVLLPICLLVLCGILVVGLWPFHAPRNDVTRLSGRKGLLLGKHGTVVSASPFKAGDSQGDKSCSLEIWLEPTRVDSEGMILAFYWPANMVMPFAARQWRSGLVLERESHGHFANNGETYVGDVFKSLNPVFVTITSGEAGVATYVDGKLVKKFPHFVFVRRDLTGQLVIGSAPSTSYNWHGQFKGLAVYDRELSVGDVSQHYAEWTENKQTELAKSEGIVGLYLLNEGSGNVIHSEVTSAPDLLISERFFVVDKWFLEPFWREYRSGWSYWKDVGINVTGFIPLGLFFCSYLSLVRRIKRPALVTIVLGFLVSLTIEVLQAFLPTRDSGMTDLITNTFGTALGALLCLWSTSMFGLPKKVLRSASIPRKRENLQLIE
jgi:VanZ like family/Concanavalin A-like lectin/glucanases superfamily